MGPPSFLLHGGEKLPQEVFGGNEILLCLFHRVTFDLDKCDGCKL
jgi:hypothetical protein